MSVQDLVKKSRDNVCKNSAHIRYSIYGSCLCYTTELSLLINTRRISIGNSFETRRNKFCEASFNWRIWRVRIMVGEIYRYI